MSLFNEAGQPLKILAGESETRLFDEYGRPIVVLNWNGRMDSPKINEDVVLTAKATDLNLVDDPDFLHKLWTGLGRPGHWHFHLAAGGYCRHVVGSGYGWGLNVGHASTFTGGTADSSVSADCGLECAGRFGENYGCLDFGYPIIWHGKFALEGACATSIARLQLKGNQNLGDIVDNGFGIIAKNYALYFETVKGTSRKETSLATTISSALLNGYLVVLDPAIPKIDVYINTGSGWVLKYTETDASKIAVGLNYISAMSSIENGATAQSVSLMAGVFMVGIKQ